MSSVFETIQTEGLAEISYLIGDDEEGIAAVFDPRADVDVYTGIGACEKRRHYSNLRDAYSCRSR